MKKLHLGCGGNILSGWDNLDWGDGSGIIKCDLSEALPYNDRSITHIYSEHFIEHLDEVDGFNLMKECYRVLIPNGKLRFSCPDLKQYVEAYLDWEKQTASDKNKFTSGTNFLNYAILGEAFSGIKYLSGIGQSRDYGHRYYYDWAEMSKKLDAAGFSQIKLEKWRQSQIPEFQNLESRPARKDLIVEAVKNAS